MPDISTQATIQDASPVTASGDSAPSNSEKEKRESPPTQPLNKYKHQIEYRNTRSDESISFDKAGIPNITQKENDPIVFEYFDVRLTRDPIPKDRRSPNAASTLNETGTGHPYIQILSPAVNEALRCVVDYYPSLDLSVEKIRVPAPYAVFFHFEQEINAYVDRLQESCGEGTPTANCPNKCAAEHITIVQSWIKAQYQEKVDTERQLYAQGLATFDMLWLLYKPGDDIYADAELTGEHEPFVLKSTIFDIKDGTTEFFNLKFWCMDANELIVAPAQFESYQDSFAGTQKIVDLRFFPCQYLKFMENLSQDDFEGIREYFTERGRRWYNLRRQVRCYSFDGVTVSHPRRNVSGYIIVDPVQYRHRDGDHRDGDSGPSKPRRYLMNTVEQFSPPLRICKCSRCENVYKYAVKQRFTGYSEINPLTQDSLTDHQYFLCNKMVEAFLLKTRSWEQLHISGVKDATFDLKMFDRLVLKQQTKDLVRDLVRMYIRDRKSFSLQDVKPYVKLGEVHRQEKESSTKTTWSADFVQGKGEGLTFLLHGKPGVGKTYTAECISHLTKRPLLTLTCADIGVSPKEIEANLSKWFKMAEKWGAIMLIDEADIYMEERQAGDIERNHLVAGFLRALEYFKGILFLTTNRVGVFDEAFISRVHVKLFYPDFNDKDREKIWSTFFDKLEEDRETSMRITQAAKDYIQSTEIVELKWNGREIRNAFQIAVALAESQEDKDKQGRVLIKLDHLKATVEMSREFREYLSTLHMADPSKRAFHKGVRYDNFGSPDNADKKLWGR